MRDALTLAEHLAADDRARRVADALGLSLTHHPLGWVCTDGTTTGAHPTLSGAVEAYRDALESMWAEDTEEMEP